MSAAGSESDGGDSSSSDTETSTRPQEQIMSFDDMKEVLKSYRKGDMSINKVKKLMIASMIEEGMKKKEAKAMVKDAYNEAKATLKTCRDMLKKDEDIDSATFDTMCVEPLASYDQDMGMLEARSVMGD